MYYIVYNKTTDTEEVLAMGEFFSKVKVYVSIVFTVLFAMLGIGLPARATKSQVEKGLTRIMSFNVRCGEYEPRFSIVPQLIGEYMPDSVGIQECTYQWYLTLRFMLPEYEFIGVGRDTGDRKKDCGEMSAVLYRKDKYELVDSGTFWLSETPEEVSFGWDAACRRVCTWVVLKNKQTGEKYAHVNTHLDHKGPLARENGVELVREKALTFDIPTVVTGDFNFSKGCELYTQLVSSGLTDTQDIARNTMAGKTYHGYEGGEEGLPIDYILVNNRISEVDTYKIIRDKYGDEYSSDHYPIYADMIIG